MLKIYTVKIHNLGRSPEKYYFTSKRKANAHVKIEEDKYTRYPEDRFICVQEIEVW